MAEIKLTLQCKSRLIVESGLTVGSQLKMRRHWDKVVNDPLAFTPHEKKGRITVAEAIEQNSRLGEFASERLKQIFQRSTPNDKIRRMENKKKVVAVGYGRGYDSQWVKEAMLAGFQVWWVDVSDVSCNIATSDMKNQYDSFAGSQTGLAPMVKQGEIRSIFADPSSVGLDLNSVEIWYFCRTLTCLSERSAKAVLCQLGCSLNKATNTDGNNSIEIISAMRDYNPSRVGHSSKLYYIKDIVTQLKLGAERPIKLVDEESTKYFDQIYTGITVRSK